jgi:hypothetical protein
VTGRGPDLFAQGMVLADTKTARHQLRVFVPSSTVVPVLNAFGLFAVEPFRKSQARHVPRLAAGTIQSRSPPRSWPIDLTHARRHVSRWRPVVTEFQRCGCE